MSGKGDTRRPTNEKAYSDNYARIFGSRDLSDIVEPPASKMYVIGTVGNKELHEYRTNDGKVIGRGHRFINYGQPLTEPETGKESEILCKTVESDQIQAGRKAHPIS